MLTEMALRRRGREQGNNSTTLFHWEGRKLKVSSIYSPGRSIRPLVSDFPLEERLPRFQEHKINVWACLYWTYTKLHRGWKEQKKSVNTWRQYELYKYCRKNDGEKQKAQTNFSSQKFFALVIAYLTVHWPLPGDAFPTVLRLLIILLCSLSLHFFFFLGEHTHESGAEVKAEGETLKRAPPHNMRSRLEPKSRVLMLSQRSHPGPPPLLCFQLLCARSSPSLKAQLVHSKYAKLIYVKIINSEVPNPEKILSSSWKALK